MRLADLKADYTFRRLIASYKRLEAAMLTVTKNEAQEVNYHMHFLTLKILA